MDSIDELLEKAKQVAKRKYPYLSRLLTILNVVPHDVPELHGALGIDMGGRLYYNEAMLRQVFGDSLPDLAEGVVHEALHLLLRHFERRGGREEKVWNIATDAEINDDLTFSASVASKVITPLMLGLPDGQPAEWYYSQLEQGQQRQQGQQEQGQGDKGQGQQQGAQQGQGQQQGQSQGAQQGRGGARQRQQGQQQGICGGGSGVTGVPAPWELPPDDAQTPAATQSEIDTALRGVAADMKEYCRSRGILPAWAQRWVEEWERARSAWRKVSFERLVARVLSVEGAIIRGRGTAVDWRRRNKRFTHSEFVFPAKSQRVPNVLVVVDTSGSMRESDLATCMAGVEKGLKVFGGRCTVAAWDAALRGVRQVTSVRQAVSMLKGGGGTSMKAAIEWAEKQNPRPDLVIVMTDGETDWVDRPPRIRTVIFTINNPSAHSEVPEFLKRHTYIIGGEES